MKNRKVYKGEVGKYVYSMYKMNSFTITKKIAKHGKQAILVIPKILENKLKPGTIVKVTMDVIDDE